MRRRLKAIRWLPRLGLIVSISGLWTLDGCAHLATTGRHESTRVALSSYLRGLMLERSSHLSDALDAYYSALEHDSRSPSLHVRIGATHVKLGQPDQALKSFERALALDPSHEEALRWMALLQTSQGKLPEAIQAYERLLAQQPTDRFILSILADLYVLRGDLAKAVELYEQLIKAHGSTSRLHFNLGVLYGRLGQFSMSLQELSRALELAPDSVDVRVALGLTYELHQQLDQARAYYEDAIRLNPLNPTLSLHAARVCAAQHQTQDAMAHYLAVLDLEPREAEAIVGLVRVLMDAKRFDQAQQVIGTKLSLFPQPSDPYLLLGLVYREAGQPVEAMRAFERAAVSKDASPQPHFYLGAQLGRLGRRPEARAQLRRAIQLDPNHADALNYLGYLDAEDGVNLQEAKTLIERALAIDPDNGAYIDSLGWVYYQLGQIDQAVVHLERASQLLNTDPILFDHLGDARFKRGDREEAANAWRKALELDHTLDGTKRKLEQLFHYEVPRIR